MRYMEDFPFVITLPLSLPVTVFSLCGKSHENSFSSSKKLRPVLSYPEHEIVGNDIIILLTLIDISEHNL